MKLFGLQVPFTERRNVAVTNDSAFTGSDYVFFGDTGEVVTPNQALSSTAVFACVKIIAETVSSVPLVIYEKDGPKNKKKAEKLALYKVLRSKPNNRKTSGVEFRQMLMAHVLLWG